MIALMMLVISATSTWHGTEAFCPFKCHCDDQKMKVICTSEANLDIIPITLNPGIKEIHLRENQIRYVTLTYIFIFGFKPIFCICARTTKITLDGILREKIPIMFTFNTSTWRKSGLHSCRKCHAGSL